MQTRWFLPLLLAGLIGTVPAMAEGYASTVARAAQARDRALETGSSHDWQEALELFAAAVELEPTVDAKFEFAEAAAQLGLDDEAYAAYQEALALGLAGKAAERAQRFVDEHRATLGALIVSGPEGARLYIDNRKRGTLPLAAPLPLRPGVRHLDVEAAGFVAKAADVTVEANATTSYAAELAPKRQAEASPGRSRAPAGRPVILPLLPRPRGAWAWPVLIGGSGLVVAGVTTIVATSVAIGRRRDDLAHECAVLDGDECVSTTAPHVSNAQSIGNDILALKGLRWTAVGAAVVGAVAAGVSVREIERHKPKRVPAEASLDLAPGRVLMRVRCAF